MSRTEEEIMTNREFIAALRAKLDEAGHPEIAVDRQWIREDQEGEPFLLLAPIGSELVVPLKGLDGLFNSPASECDWYIGHFADALVNLRAAEKMLVKYASDVRRTASREIGVARAEGLDLQLEGVGFKPVYAYHLTHRSWKEAALHVLASVKVRNTSFFLQPGVDELWVEEPSDVVEELRSVREDQRRRQERLAVLDALGADLELDALTFDLLTTHGIDAGAILREVWRKQHVELRLPHFGGEAILSLVTYESSVRSNLTLDDAHWNGEHLWFRKEEHFTGLAHLVGKSLGDRVGHPVFSSRPVMSVSNRSGDRDLISFDLSDKLLFDADEGRLWREQRRLAA